MVELQHGAVPPALLAFCAANPTAPVSDFESSAFQPAKVAAKAALHGIQGGLCVYCEKALTPTQGQVEHIKPKGGPTAHPLLCFVYTNFAQSCNHISGKTCGQKKGHALLPIEPAPGCNAEWNVSTNGTIGPLLGLLPPREAAVTDTLKMLGLNDDSDLVDERKKWLARTIEILTQAPADLSQFLQTAPFRQILAVSV